MRRAISPLTMAADATGLRRVGGVNEDNGDAPLPICQLLPLLAAVGQRERVPPLRRGELRRRNPLPLEAPGVKHNRPARAEGVTLRTVSLVGVTDFGDGADGELRGQPELSPNGVVSQFVQVKGAEGLRLPRPTRQRVAGSVELGECVVQRGGRNVIDTEFTGNGFHPHTGILPGSLYERQHEHERVETAFGREEAIPPLLKGYGCPGFIL